MIGNTIETLARPLLLLAVALIGSGCVSFSGPNDVRRMIADQEELVLDQEVGVTVGPVGVFLASTLVGGYLPMDVNGVDWVSFGSYEARPKYPSTMPLNFRNLELPGWERVVRVCDQREDVLVMIPEDDGKLRKILVVIREGNQVSIARVQGDLEKILDRVLESDLVDDDIMQVLDGGGGDACVEARATVPAHASMAALASIGGY